MVACTPFGTAQYHSDTLRHAYCFKFVIKSIRLKVSPPMLMGGDTFIYDGFIKNGVQYPKPYAGDCV